MKSIDAYKRIVKMSGTSQRELSKRMGRSENFVSSIGAQRKSVGADLLAEIARACDYELILRGHGEEIVIDPPK